MRKGKRSVLGLVMALVMVLASVPIPELRVQAAEEYGVWVGDQQFTSEKTVINDVRGKGKASFDNASSTLTFEDFEGVEGEHEISENEYALIYAEEKAEKRTIKIGGKAVLAAQGENHNGICSAKDVDIEILPGADISVTTESYSVYGSADTLSVSGKLQAKTTNNSRSAVYFWKVQINDGAELCAEAVEQYGNGIYTDTLTVNGGTVNALTAGANGKAIRAGSEFRIYGGVVSAVATGSDGVGIETVMAGINGGEITAAGDKQAINADVSISVDPSLTFVEPVGGHVSTDGKKILDAEENEAKSFHLGVFYDLWLGNTRVSETNKSDIPGVSGGKASYDPATATLTFTGDVNGVEGLCNEDGFASKIYAKGDLTIKGKAQLNYMDVQLGIGTTGKLVIDGDINVYAKNFAVITTGTDTALEINGKLEASTYVASAVSVTGDIIVAGEGLFATTTNKATPAVETGKKLIINSGVLDASGDVYSIKATGGIEIPTGYGITIPEGGKLSTDNTTVMESDGTTQAKHARIEEVTFYDLWVGGVQVSSKNAGEIPSVSGGKASYDSMTNTLSFTGDVSGVEGLCNEDGFSSKIYTKGDLTIKGDISLNYPEVQLGIGTTGKLILDGKVDVYAKNWAVAAMGEQGSIEINKRLNAQSIVAAAVSTDKGDITVAGEGLFATTGSDTSPAVDAGKKLILNSGVIDAQGDGYALAAKEEIQLPEGVAITLPKEGQLSSDKKTVVESDGTTVAKHARIEGDTFYDLWLGETQVTDKNKGDIPSVTGGKASYDPESRTLTFTGDACELSGLNKHDAYDAQIYSGDELTIEGKVKLENEEAMYGIYTKGKLNINGDVTAKGISHGVYAENSALQVSGTLNAASDEKRAIEAADITVNGGKVTANGTTAIIAKDIMVRDGELTAQGDKTAIDAKNFILDGGRINAYVSGDGALTEVLKASGRVEIRSGNAVLESSTRTKCNVLTAGGGVLVSGGSLKIVGKEVGDHATLNGMLDTELNVTGGNVSIEMTGGMSIKAISNDAQDVVVSGGSLRIRDSGQAYPVQCRNFTVSGGTVEVKSETGATAIVATAFHMSGGKLTADSTSEKNNPAIVTASHKFTLGDDVQIVEPAGGRICDDASRIADAEGNEAMRVVLAGPGEAAAEEEMWNLFESDERSFEIAALSSGSEVENKNAKSAKYYDAKLNGNTISVKLKSGVNRKQAAKPANTVLEFDLGSAGVAVYVIPVQYVKPVFKLVTKSVTIRDGAETTVRTQVLAKTEYGNYEACDLSGMTVKYGSIDAIGDSDGYVSFKTPAAVKGAKLTIDKPGVWESPIALKFSVKAVSKDLLSVDLDGRKVVLLNKKISGQYFEFPVSLNGAAVTAETAEITKGSEVAELTAGGMLKLMAKDETKTGNYTVTISQKGGNAKLNLKVKVSDKAVGQAVALKVRSKYDVVSGQKMLVEPVFKEAEAKILSVASETEKFTAELDGAGNILIDYSGERNVKKLNLGDINLKLVLEGVSEPVSFTLAKVKAKKTMPKVRSAAVTLNKDAAGEVKACVNVVCSYRDGAGKFHTIVPSEAGVELKKVKAQKNALDPNEIDIQDLEAKSGSVKLKLSFAGGAEKKLTIKVKKAK